MYILKGLPFNVDNGLGDIDSYTDIELNDSLIPIQLYHYWTDDQEEVTFDVLVHPEDLPLNKQELLDIAVLSFKQGLDVQKNNVLNFK